MDKKILIVDDEPDVLKMVVFRIKKLGFEVLTATDGLQALKIAEDKPDLVLLDLRMPGMTGLEVCTVLKADPGLKHIPVILMTASTDSLADKVNQCGAVDYIVKPFEAEELIEKIRQHLG